MYYSFFALTKILTAISLWNLVHCQKSEFVIVKATHCDSPGLKVLVENITLHNQHSKSYLNARFHALEDIKALKKINLHIERCDNQGKHCEHFQNIKVERLCQIISRTNQYWIEIVNHIYPPFRCPIKKMTYEVRNATLDLDGITNWYPDVYKYRWRTTSKGFNERDTVVSCEILIIDIHENRKQDG